MRKYRVETGVFEIVRLLETAVVGGLVYTAVQGPSRLAAVELLPRLLATLPLQCDVRRGCYDSSQPQNGSCIGRIRVSRLFLENCSSITIRISRGRGLLNGWDSNISAIR